MKRKRVLLHPILVSVLGVLLGCSPTLHPVAVGDTPPVLVFLRDYRTTKAQVVERLGESTRSFPDDVVVYRFSGWFSHDPRSMVDYATTDSCAIGFSASDRCYDLVLVFDASGILKAHRLLRVR